MTDEEKIICNDIEKMLISIENKVDWIIEIRRLIDNMNKQNKNIIIQRMFKLEDIFREICQILNKTIFYIKRNQSNKKYKENNLINPSKNKIKNEEIKIDIDKINIDNKNKDIKPKKEFIENNNRIY